MQTKQEFKKMTANIVYLKQVDISDLPLEVQDQAGGLDRLFAMHNGKGEQVALVASEAVAGFLAAQNNLKVVTLH